jgi:glycosyltransferase involved in cell wall biosynthesis
VRVGIFTDNDFDKVNGVTTALRAVIEHAPAGLGARVYTCAPREVSSPTYRAFRTRGMPIPFYREMRMYLPPLGRLLREVREDGISVIHLTTPGPMGLAAMWIARRLRLPVVGSFHTDLVAYVRALSGSHALAYLMRQYMRWPYGRCAQVCVPSEASRALLAELQIHPDRVRVWRRGVSTSRFSPARRSDQLRTAWQVSEARPALLYVGRVSKEKGLAALAPLACALAQRGLAHRMVIVGDGPMRAELARALPGAIFTGTLPPEDVAVAMASSDLFVFPSRTDTAGNVVLEAQASGVPALVMRDGGPHENVDDGRSGIVCSGPAALRNAVVHLLQCPDTRRAFSAGARVYAGTRQWSAALAPLYRAYEEVSLTPFPQVPYSHGEYESPLRGPGGGHSRPRPL